MVNSAVIVYPRQATFHERLAAKEIRRYLYVRTAVLLPLLSEDQLPAQSCGFVVGYYERPLITDLIGVQEERHSSVSEQSYMLKTVTAGGGRWIAVTGGQQGGLLYAAYRLAEHYGIRFSLHGDIVPDRLIQMEVMDIAENSSPLFQQRGILPFHDFPEGPDWWNEDDYKSVLAQLPKLRMNFIGLHTYPERPRTNLYASAEPATWIGLAEDVKENGEVVSSYQSRHFTTINGAWGYASQTTGTYTDGGDQLFERDDYGADYMQDMAPWPQTMEHSNELFNRFGKLLNSVFTYASTLGISTCLGTEAPLTIPQEVKDRLIDKGMDPDAAETKRLLYEGIFTRIKQLHPLDYFWLWTPESWTWGGNSEEQTQAALNDFKTAIDAAEKVNPSIQVATSGWVLGPQADRTLFDRHLPKSVPFSCINRNLGFDFVEPGFHAIQDRPKWAIPWVEDDPAMNLPQLWAGRMRQDAADAYAYGCNGLMGIHWRTKVVDPTLAALADAGWEQSEWNDNFGRAEEMEPYSAEGSTGGRVVTLQRMEAASESIYNTARVGAKSYSLQIPNGMYKVTLKFREWEVTGTGKRVFDVFTNSGIDKRLYQVDIFAGAGLNKPWERSIEEVKVSDGVLKLTFKTHSGEPSLCAIVVEGMTDGINQFEGFAFSRHINCGGLAVDDYEADLPELKDRDRDLPISDFYADWAAAQFGCEAAKEIAVIFNEIDGKLPRPITWVSGPGSTIVVNRTVWKDVAEQYAFVDRLEALRIRVYGAGQLARFDYWLEQFLYLRSAAQIGCTLGMYEAAMEAVREEDSDDRQREMAKAKLLPIRKELVRQYAEMNAHLLATVSTPGELGTFANVQQQTMHTQLHKPGKELEELLGESLPLDAMPISNYTGKSRLIVPTVRTSLAKGEPLQIKAILIGAAPRALVIYWRFLGEHEIQNANFTHVNRGVYQISLDLETDDDFEYYIEATMAEGEPLRFPASAPNLNQTVVITDRGE